MIVGIKLDKRVLLKGTSQQDGSHIKLRVSEQVANGLRIYFDKALRHMLLYAQEMEQADKVQPLHYSLSHAVHAGDMSTM